MIGAQNDHASDARRCDSEPCFAAEAESNNLFVHEVAQDDAPRAHAIGGVVPRVMNVEQAQAAEVRDGQGDLPRVVCCSVGAAKRVMASCG